MANIVLNLTAVDKASPVLKKLGDTTKRIGVGLAAAGAVAAGAVLAFGIESAQSLMRVQKLGAQTDAVIKSMGATSWTTKDQIVALSDRLEKLTSTESEAIQEGANLLLTFGNIRNEAGKGNDIFDRTTGLMVDMARAMGTDVSSGAIQLGKALNDPIKGVSALSEVGVSFTEDQKELIKTLVESGDVMGAQKVILDELQKQFGGSGAAYADTFAGKMDTLQNNIGAAGEAVMTKLMPELEKLIDWINTDGLIALDGLVNWIRDDAIPGFQDLVDWVIKYKDILGPAAAALGTLTAAQWVLNAAMAANPVGLVIAGLMALVTAAVLVAVNWNAVTKLVYSSSGSIVKGMLDIAVGVTRAVEGVINALLSGLSLVASALNPLLRMINLPTINLPGSVDFSSQLAAHVNRIKMMLDVGAAGGIDAVTSSPDRSRVAAGQRVGNRVRAFAEGGGVMSATIALIGEREPEAVVPFSKVPDFVRAAGYGGNGGGDTIVVKLNGFAIGTEDQLARSVARAITQAKRSGAVSKRWND